jgi:hypothetical protein
MVPAFPFKLSLFAEFDVGLIDESGRLQQMTRPLAPQKAMCLLAKLVIKKRKYLLGLDGLTFAPGLEHSGYFQR